MSNFGLFFIFVQVCLIFFFFACVLQIDRKTLHCIFFSLVFSKNNVQKTLEIQKGYFVETKGFLCFSLNRRTAKEAASNLNVFCIRYFSKMKRKQAKKIQRNVLLSICSSHSEN